MKKFSKSLKFFFIAVYSVMSMNCNQADTSGKATTKEIKENKTATVKLKRRKQTFLNMAADVSIYINEKGCGVIKNGESIEVEFIPLKSGNNSIRLEAMGAELMDALEKFDSKIKDKTRKSLPFKAKPNEVVSFICNYDSELTLSQVENEVLEN